MNSVADGWMICPVCGARMAPRKLLPGQELRCGRCGTAVRRAPRRHLLPVCWALGTAGLLLCALANLTPLLPFEIAGRAQSNWIWTGVAGLARQGYWPVAALVFFCAVAAPVGHLAGVWY
ncbi:MAG: paraquat-inducible protein A, partial [Terrimicrobiaceae bacterium]|nr:paraquat-inducible protein A [Terrimicrobiaceae bacterium]